jgi:hypothetical protein
LLKIKLCLIGCQGHRTRPLFGAGKAGGSFDSVQSVRSQSSRHLAWMTDFAFRSRISLQTAMSVQSLSLWKKRNRMKKNRTQGQEQQRKSRRLSLNRETLQILNHPGLLQLARGGDFTDFTDFPPCNLESTSQTQHTGC